MRRSPLRRVLRSVALLLLAAVLGVAALLAWTGGEYPPASTRPPEVTAPGPFRPPSGAAAASPARRTVVVMVFDGLAPSMLDGQDTPALDRLRREGSWSFKGMTSPEVRAAVAETDRAVATVLAALEPLGNAALIVTTDHGMRPTAEIINVEYLLRRHHIAARMVATGTTAFLYLDGKATRPAAIEALSQYDAFETIMPEAQPAWSHLGTGPRSGDLILSAKPPYAIEDRGQLPWFVRWLAWTGPTLIDASSTLHASHGYPPDTPGVHGVFFAWGDGVRRGQQLARVDAVDIHPTVTRLLGIEPGQPVDGRPVAELLTDG